MSSSEQKWNITFFSTFLFILVTNKQTYKLTNYLFKNIIGNTTINNCPTYIGYILHIIIFTLIVRYSMDLDIV